MGPIAIKRVRGPDCFLFFSLLLCIGCRAGVPQPRANLPYLPPHLVDWIWSGAVTETSAVIKARLTEDARDPRLLIFRKTEEEVELSLSPSQWNSEYRIAEFEVRGLQPGTHYRYQIESDGEKERFRHGLFRTLPAASSSFTIAFSACAKTGSNGAVFETIRQHDPLLFLHLGDFHYANIRAEDPTLYVETLSQVLASPVQSALYRSLPIMYIWDDHDYGPDNSDRTHPGRTASRRAYQLTVPHYPLGAGVGDVPIYQSFTVGKVHFIVTDSRSERDPPGESGVKSLLGAAQKAWFKREMLEGKESAWLIVWVNSVPWIDPEGQSDGWGGFAEERAEIAQFLAREKLPPIAILSGDAHMLAIDDGSNSRYAEGQPLIPVFHAAALDRPGSIKGGPYSEGSIAGGGFFGLMETRETDSELIVNWSGRDWTDREIIGYHFSVPKKSP